jgi:large subunit ribosomal protein L18e
MRRKQVMMNSELKKVIRALGDASRSSGKQIWAALADELDKPKRRRVSVNLSKITRNSKEGDVVAVPGKVLASGSIGPSLTVAAFSFSDSAREKILASGSQVLSLFELIEQSVEPSRIRIVK